MEIRDSQILITGASQGIGKEVALMCAENKAHLHLLVQNEEPSLKAEIEKAGAKSVHVYQVDLSNRKQVENFLNVIQEVEIDILFNNADHMTGGLLEEQSIDEIYSMMQMNTNSLIHLTHAFLPGMLKRKKGKIINHSSVAAVMNFPGSTVYAASKAAVLSFTNSLRAELKNTGVSTLVLLTSGADTRLFKDIPKIYGAKLDLGFLKPIPPKQYAQMLREAILEDLHEVKPSGFTAAGLLMAQHLPRIFENIVSTRFKRS